MNIRKKILTRCGALLTAVLVLAPTALAAEAEIPYIPQTVPAAQLAPADQRGQEDWQLLLVNPWHTVPRDMRSSWPRYPMDSRWTNGSMMIWMTCSPTAGRRA